MRGIKGKETVLIERHVWGPDDAMGNPTSVRVQVPITGCLIAWGTSAETTDLFGASVDTQATIQFPQNTQTLKTDTFVLPNGKRYIQQGDGVQWVGQVGNPIKQKKLVNVIIKEGGQDG